jgi:hypothetical protein
MFTGSFALKSLTDTWTGSIPEFGSNGTTTVVLTQSGTSLSGTYSDTASNTGSVSGSVNATTRRVTFTVTWSADSSVKWGFSGTPDDAAAKLTGVCTNVQKSGCANNTWTMSRP